ncbi:MAG: glycosyltransferase family 4 protein [Nitrospinae bacterium]|nr:glycosyltransferase family 4 protein [Nitrospinota bacterium]
MNDSEKKLTVLSLQYHCYPDEVGGAWGLTHEVNKRLADRGQKVHLITCKPEESLPNEEKIDGVFFHRISVKDSKSVISIWRTARKKVNHILKSGKIDLIHIHNPLVGFAVILLPKLWNVPKVCHFHSSWFDEERINQVGTETTEITWKLKFQLELIRLMEWTGYAVSHTIFFLSEYSKNRFLKYYPFAKPKLSVIPGGVDTEEFKPPNSMEQIKPIREELKLPVDTNILLTVRRLEQRMGLENLICAAGILQRRSPDLKFQIVLAGRGRLKSSLEELIVEQGVSHCIRLVGLVPRETLPLYFRCADLFVLPTTAIEGFGLVTAEAMASGLPVMGTPIGATVEILKQVDDRLLFQNTSPESLAEGIESFLKDPELFYGMSTKCRDIAETRYSWNTVVEKIEKEYIEVTT